MIKVISPIDNSIVCERHLASDDEVSRALTRAQKAKKQWKQTDVQDRATICMQFLEAIENEKQAIANELTWQMGRPVTQAISEVNGLIERARYMIKIAQKTLEDIEISDDAKVTKTIKREPLGLVFIIAPWNYPYLTAINSIIPALMAGNVVLLKHSAKTPLCAERFADAFKKTNIPEGVFQYSHLSHEQVNNIIQSRQVDFIAFTGSYKGGQAVSQAAAETFLGFGLELGGKDPAYVREDADLGYAINHIADGAFYNAGQSCCAIERVYVHSRVYDDFIEGLISKVQQFKLGNPLEDETTLGPMVSSAAARYVMQQVEQATSHGASALLEQQHKAAYLSPQVLVNVDHDMDIMREETFGPALGVMKVNSDEEAISLMNDSDYGLTASVWTQDVDVAKKIAHQIETGTFFMNQCDTLDPALAWTGVKNSGRGCSLSALGYEQLTRPKSFYLKRV